MLDQSLNCNTDIEALSPTPESHQQRYVVQQDEISMLHKPRHIRLVDYE